MADYSAWIEELEKRSGVGNASNRSSDLANLQGKNPEDVAQYQEDLEAQYGRRAASQTTGSGTSSENVRAPSDIKKGFGAGGSNENPAGNQPASVAQQWIQGSTSGGGDSTGGGMSWGSAGSGNVQNQDPRAAALYEQLLGRSQQGLALDRNDPVIRAQSDAYGANAERAKRNYLGDVAEQSGPLANIRGEERMAAERVGQQTGSFEAELMGRELTSRRQEIAQALTSMQGMLSADQQAGLTRELAALDAAIKREGLKLQGQGLNLQGQQMGQQNDQFLRELAQRQWYQGDQSDLSWAGLGG